MQIHLKQNCFQLLLEIVYGRSYDFVPLPLPFRDRFRAFVTDHLRNFEEKKVSHVFSNSKVFRKGSFQNRLLVNSNSNSDLITNLLLIVPEENRRNFYKI